MAANLPSFWSSETIQNLPTPLGVAVSGGGDSIALLHVLAQSMPAAQLHVLHFNHNLRPSAAEDEAFVKKQCAALGVQVASETWQEQPTGNLQQAAREARYAFMAKAAKDYGLAAIATAHTADDVAETALMRMGKGSGLTGLTSLVRQSSYQNIPIIRPLLHVARDELRGWLSAQQLSWQEDPSNEDPTFQRVRVRNLKADLTAAGIEFSAIAASVSALARAADALAAMEADWQKQVVALEANVVTLAPGFMQAPAEVQLNLLGKAITHLAPAPQAPRTTKRARALRHMATGQLPYQLGGVEIQAVEKGYKLVPVPLATAAAAG